MTKVTLYNEDVLAVLSRMDDNSIDLVACDPPYRTISGGKKPKEGYGYHVSVLKENNGKIFEYNDIKPRQYMSELYRVLKPGRDFYVMTNTLNLRDTWNAAEEAGFKFHNLLTWVKNTATPNRWYMKDTEQVLYFYKSPARPINHCGKKQTLPHDNPRNKDHPTQKPVGLFEDFISSSSEEGWTVLDPFMGSGATGLACKKLNRNFIGVELDEKYFNIAKDKLNG